MSVFLTEVNVFHILRYLFKINGSVVFICPTANIFMLPWFEAFSSKYRAVFVSPSSKLHPQPVVPSQCDIGKKGKAIPFQVCTGPEGSRRLRLPDFKTIGT